VGKH